MTTDKIIRAKTDEEKRQPTTRTEMRNALAARLEGTVVHLSPPKFGGGGRPDFFYLARKKLHVVKVIGEQRFQPHEQHYDRSLSIAVALFILDKNADTTPDQDEWLAFARSAGIQCHIARTWGEVEYALMELEAI